MIIHHESCNTVMRRVIISILSTLTLLSYTTSASAGEWKPFTHNTSASEVWLEVTQDHKVTIDGRDYVVKPEIVDALTDRISYFNAGVVGPDGFPDIAYGQGIIHPEQTGQWLKHIFDSAWNVQTDSSYSSEERKQVLAFTYGYLTHAAGDMWAHTLINDFALGVFPSVSELPTDQAKREVAFRHLIIEGYFADATPGHDGNREDRNTIGNDVSDDDTPGVPFDVPNRFVYDTLIDLQANAPDGKRGQLLDFFFDLEVRLQVMLYKYRFDLSHIDCPVGPLNPGCEAVPLLDVPVPTVRGDRYISLVERKCTRLCPFPADPADLADDPVNRVIVAYLDAWIQDIDAGIREWPELSLAIARGLFDPQARRNYQNKTCRFVGSEESISREECERKVSMTGVVLNEADSYIKEHMLSMLGLPDVSANALAVLQKAADFVDALGLPFNPIRNSVDQLQEIAENMIKRAVLETTGASIDMIHSFITYPSSWLDVSQVVLPEVGDVRLFFPGDSQRPSDHARLDALMGLGDNHHVSNKPPLPGFPVASTRLSDNIVATSNKFAILHDTNVMARLLMLDGRELNRALGDVLKTRGVLNDAASVRTYSNEFLANVMLHGIDVVSGRMNGSTWLRSIDSDHAWRVDGLPRFCDENPIAGGCATATGGSPVPRSALHNGGEGNFPLWKSCLLRPAFRALFKDWENEANAEPTFPNLGDDGLAPDVSDFELPDVDLALGDEARTVGAVTYVGRDHRFTVTATDKVFAPNQLTVQIRAYPEGVLPPEWQLQVNGGQFSLPVGASDGLWRVEARASDPCHLQQFGPNKAMSVVLDTHPPALTCQKADGNWHADNIAIPCTAKDESSGLAKATDASFSLVTSVPAGTETDNAISNSQVVCDVVANCATAGPVAGNMIDRKAPTIVVTSPIDGHTYVVGSIVQADFKCHDGGSGVATCAGTLPVGSTVLTSAVGRYSLSVKATDAVGNAGQTVAAYKVTYGVCLKYYPSNSLGHAGTTVILRLRLCDVAQRNVESHLIAVRAIGVVGLTMVPTNFIIPLDHGDRFWRDPVSATFVYRLRTKGLLSGDHTMWIEASGDPETHAVKFQLH